MILTKIHKYIICLITKHCTFPCGQGGDIEGEPVVLTVSGLTPASFYFIKVTYWDVVEEKFSMHFSETLLIETLRMYMFLLQLDLGNTFENKITLNTCGLT